MIGCDREFTTGNYLVTTTPRKEYEIATGKRECPEGDMLDRKGRRVRVIRSIDALKTLEICRRAGLRDYEILAVVRARIRVIFSFIRPWLFGNSFIRPWCEF